MADTNSRPLSRRWLYIPFIVAGIIFFAYFLLWNYAADKMKTEVEGWVAQQRASGLSVEHGTIKAEGFPFFLRIKIDTPQIGEEMQWRWGAQALYLDALPYQLDRIIFSPYGAQKIWTPQINEWSYSADDFRASIARDKERGWKFATTIGALKANRGADEATLTSLLLDFAPDAADPTTLTLNFAAEDAAAELSGEKYTMAKLHLVTALTRSDTLNGENAARQWASMGGELQLVRVAAELEETSVLAAGTVTLDHQNYPHGAIDTEWRKPAGLTRLFGRIGVLTSTEAETAAAGLSLMAIAGGGKINAPIELSDGAARISGIKLADLPSVQ